MTETFRLWFAIAYLVGFVYFLGLILWFRARRPAVEQRSGPLPPPSAVISWLIPPALLLTGLGAVPEE